MRTIMKHADTDFCVRCGKTAEIEKFCAECFAAGAKLFSVKDFKVEMCSCGMINDREWKKESMSDRRAGRMKEYGQVDGIRFTQRRIGNRIRVHLTASGSVKNIPVEQENDFIITVRTIRCDICSKKSGNYHEAVMQARGDMPEKIVDRIRRMCRPEDITAVIPLKSGYDVRFMDKGVANMV